MPSPAQFVCILWQYFIKPVPEQSPPDSNDAQWAFKYLPINFKSNCNSFLQIHFAARQSCYEPARRSPAEVDTRHVKMLLQILDDSKLPVDEGKQVKNEQMHVRSSITRLQKKERTVFHATQHGRKGPSGTSFLVGFVEALGIDQHSLCHNRPRRIFSDIDSHRQVSAKVMAYP